MNLAGKYESVAWEMRSFTAKHYDVEMVEIVNQILFELHSMLESKGEPLDWADFMLVVDMKERSLRTDHMCGLYRLLKINKLAVPSAEYEYALYDWQVANNCVRSQF